MKKILFISEPGNDGVKSHVIDLLSNLDKEKFNLSYIYSLSRFDSIYLEQIEELRANNVECIRFDLEPGLSIYDLSATFKICRFLKNRKFDVIHCHSGKAGLVGRLAAFWAGYNNIVYTPNAFPFQNNSSLSKTFLYKKAEKLLSLLTKKIICVSKSELNEAKLNGIQSDRLVLIENGVNTQNFKKVSSEDVNTIKEELNLPKDKILVLTVGRMEFQKNPQFIYKSIKAYFDKYENNIHFIHIGKGELQDEVMDFIYSNRIEDHITIIDYTDRVHFYLKACDIFLLLSRYEGLSIALLEAMACGCAVIGTDVVGIRDVIEEGKSGFLVNSDPEIVAKKINKLSEDFKTLDSMKSYNYKLIESEYSTLKMVNEVESVYEQI